MIKSDYFDLEMKNMSGKNVLVITGSPRVDGNSDRLADAFIDVFLQEYFSSIPTSRLIR